MITDVNKRIFKNCDILDTLSLMSDLLEEIDTTIVFYLNEVKLLNNIIDSISTKESLDKLEILQINFLNLLKMKFSDKTLSDDMHIFELNITENSSLNGRIENYFSNTIENKLFNKLNLNLNFNNWYVFNLPVFNFNLDKPSYSLSLNVNIGNEQFYYLLTPKYDKIIIDSINENTINAKEYANLKNYFNEILSQNIDNYSKILLKIRNEISMIGNVMEIININ